MRNKKKSKKKHIINNHSNLLLEIKKQVYKEMSKDISKHPQVQKLSQEICCTMIYYFLIADNKLHKHGKTRLNKTLTEVINLAETTDLSDITLKELKDKIFEMTGYDLSSIGVEIKDN